MTGLPASIPSPTQGVWNLGPFPIRAYALCILVGIVVAVWLTDRRWRARGGREGQVLDIAAWAVPFGIVGGRLYHVATTWQPYFGPGGHPVQALYVWEGGLGIWGAVTLGALGAWIGARRAGVLLPPFADAAAPGIVLAQGIGRLGNWFNNELYGAPTDLPWGLQIHQWDSAAGHAQRGADGLPIVLGTFHPTFLYELLWDVGTAALLIALDRRFRFGHGRLFALYVLIYTMGRAWIEALRIDPANHILGLRLNLWTSLLVGLGALAYLILSFRLRPGRETSVDRRPPTEPPADADAEAADDGDADASDVVDEADDEQDEHGDTQDGEHDAVEAADDVAAEDVAAEDVATDDVAAEDEPADVEPADDEPADDEPAPVGRGRRFGIGPRRERAGAGRGSGSGDAGPADTLP